MVDVIICGIAGKIGTLLRQNLSIHPEFSCIGGVDVNPPSAITSFPIVQNLQEVVESCDVVVDFSASDASPEFVTICRDHGRAIIVGTTGFNEEQQKIISDAGSAIPVLQCSNFAIGMVLLNRLVALAARVLRESYDVELIEWHNRNKVDSPSGSALSLVSRSAQERNTELSECLKLGRQPGEERGSSDITVHPVRGGHIISDHDVSFYGEHEVVTLRHHTLSRQVFMEGILMGIDFIADQGPGLYTLDNALEQKFNLPPLS